jgi:hypothetical protein
MDAWKNQLFFGDNLEILRSGRIPVGSVDLIYVEYPQWAPASTFKKAPRRRKGPTDKERQGGLL